MPKAAKHFKPGEAVAWDASQGEVRGKVVRTVTETTRIDGHVARATRDHPEVLVESARTGARAVHVPGELRRISARKKKR